MRKRARALGLEMAGPQRLREAFGDTLESELARRAIVLRLRREHPTADVRMLDDAVSEELEP